MIVLTPHLNLPEILERVRSEGYAFIKNGITEECRQLLLKEINVLSLEEGDHVTHAINKGKPNEVHQLHERAYYLLDDPEVPTASHVCKQLQAELAIDSWLLNEIGYQRYRFTSDWISPHRDRKSDKILSVTFTLSGNADINIYLPTTPEINYRHLKKIDTFLSEPGTVFFLRAPGFGSGEQIIHEVMPPIITPRNILNLRMRETLLPSPKNTHYE